MKQAGSRSQARGEGRIKQPQSKEGRQSRGTMDERAAERKEGRGERAARARSLRAEVGAASASMEPPKGWAQRNKGGGERSRVVGSKSGEREKQHGDTRVHAH